LGILQSDAPVRALTHSRNAQFARRANLSQPLRLSRRANHFYKPRRLAPDQEGRIAIVTDVGRGMRWTLWAAQGERQAQGAAKSCGPDPPTLGSSLRVTNSQATVANKPGHRGERVISRHTIVQGMPDVAANL
jgi:hypothetical protein